MLKPNERPPACGISIVHRLAGVPDVSHGSVHVPGIEQRNGVHNEAEGAELLLLARPVRLIEVTPSAEEHGPCEVVPASLRLSCTRIRRRLASSET